MFLNNFPYSNFHELNLDFLLEQISDLKTDVSKIKELSANFTPTIRGNYSATDTYKPLDIALYEGKFYVAVKDVPEGVTPNNTTYWIDASSGTTTGSLNLIYPDMFTGTDTEKLQQCFDVFKDDNTGGVIVINRELHISEPVIIKRRTTNCNKFLFVVGIGSENTLNFTDSGYLTDLHYNIDVGGVYFNNLNFTGSKYCFYVNALIRIFITNCHFYGFDTAIYTPDKIENRLDTDCRLQTWYLIQCYFWDLKSHAIDVYRAWDFSATQCCFENAGASVTFRYAAADIRFSNCLFEWIENDNGAILFSGEGGTHNFIIENCYFENNSRYCINMRPTPASSHNINISNCHFLLHENQYGIYLPYDLYNSTLTVRITGCDFIGAGVPYYYTNTYALTKLIREGNTGESNLPSGEIMAQYSLPMSPPKSMIDDIRVLVQMNQNGYVGIINLPVRQFDPNNLRIVWGLCRDASSGTTLSNPDTHFTIEWVNDFQMQLTATFPEGSDHSYYTAIAGHCLSLHIALRHNNNANSPK